jgi:hypothetical protein
MSSVFSRYQARRRYAEAQRESAHEWAQFTEPGGTRLSRWECLSAMADCARRMADNAVGFGRADDRDPDGYTVAQSHGLSALLLELVADTEMATFYHYDVADTDADTDAAADVVAAAPNVLADDASVAAVLARLSNVLDMRERAELTLALRDVVLGHVGHRAADVLALVACGYYVLSGMSLPEAEWRAGTGGAG